MTGSHPPAYAGGPCHECGEPWPCVSRRAELLREFAGCPGEAVAYLCDWLRAGVAERELRGLPPDPGMASRHLSWTVLLRQLPGGRAAADG
ncbi:hypothetical protein [Micromonospora sp. NPDC001898]|uniref:hypothetical protein n=1 Tax=Micromonospora sp. NPDC001898 TaxID=3364221 RepID=UPI0036A60DEC